MSSKALIMKTQFKTVPLFLLIVLFTYAAASKLTTPAEFRAQLYRQPFPRELADLLLYGLPAAELLTVLLLCLERTRAAGLFAFAWVAGNLYRLYQPGAAPFLAACALLLRGHPGAHGLGPAFGL